MARGFFLAINSLLLAIALIGCGKPAQPLRIGANVRPGYEPLFLAGSLGYYDKQSVHLLSFLSATEVVRAYRNRAIDVAAVTADEALMLAETLPDQRIILVCDFSNGADVILAEPEFKSMKDLKGRRIGVETSALGAYLLGRALVAAGMTAQDVKVVPTPVNEHFAAYRKGTVDGVVTCEPSRSRLLAAGARQVFDSAQIPGEIVGVLLTRAELVEAESQPMAAVVRGWFKALKHLKQNPADATRRMAEREQVTPEALMESLKLLELPDRAANLRLLGGSTSNLSGVLHQLSISMFEHKLLARPGNSSVLPDPRFIRSAAP